MIAMSEQTEDVDALLEELFESVTSMVLTVDELVAISHDLQLPSLLNGGLGVEVTDVNLESARRSLASKGLLTDDPEGPQLAPWLTLMADVVSDPILVFSMRREEPETRYEWMLFADQHLGVQQQVSEGGLIAWAPFRVESTIEIVCTALQLEHLESPSVGSFLSTLGNLAKADLAARDGADVSVVLGADTVAEVYGASLSHPVGTSMLSFVDRSQTPPTSSDLVWTELADSGYWQLEFSSASAPTDDTPVTVTQRSGRDLFEQIVRALPIDPEAALSEP
jgi:hypothetical protein